MTGLFHTAADAAPAEFRVGNIDCTKVSVGPMDNNSYLLASGDYVLLIDAAAEPDRLRQLIGERELVGIVTTHQHHDHVQALAQLVAATKAPTWAGGPDVAAIEQQTGVRPTPVWTGDQITDGDIQLSVIGLVGHTPGAIALVLRGDQGQPVHIFTGDSLFPGGPGRTTHPDDFNQLMDDLESKIFDVYDDDTVIYPGHGADTTLGRERPHLAEWRARGW